MKKNYVFLLIASFSLVLYSACKNISPKTPAKFKDTPISGPLLAQVDDWKIGLDDFDKSLKALEPLLKDPSIKIDYEFKVRVLDELVRNALLAQEAKRRGMEQDKDVIEIMNRYKQTVLAEKFKNDITRDVYVTDAEVEKFYNQNKDKFKGFPEFKVREIVVDTQSKANDISVRLFQGEDFAALAQANSVAQSAAKGGDLGFISYEPGNKFDKFWAAVAALDEGATSSPVKGPEGKYYILKLDAKRESETISFSKVKDELKRRLEESKKLEKIDVVVTDAKQKSKVLVNPDLLK